MTGKRTSRTTSRRNLLAAFAGTGVAVVLPSVASAHADRAVAASASSPEDTDPADAVSLGSFESGLDEWESEVDAGVDLSRVARRDRPFAVTEGEYGLLASVAGERSPTIARPVDALDLEVRPYFVADVAPGRVEATDAPVAFRFRLVDSADAGDGEPVAASDPVTVRQAAPGRLFWDASGVDADLLDAANRLEIEWFAASDGAGGASDGASKASDRAGGSNEEDADATDSPYRGDVVVDAVRATPSSDVVARAKLVATMQALQFEHGTYVRTEVTDESGDAEAGEFVFADGATEPYRFAVLDDDRYRLTVAGTVIEFGGGWF